MKLREHFKSKSKRCSSSRRPVVVRAPGHLNLPEGASLGFRKGLFINNMESFADRAIVALKDVAMPLRTRSGMIDSLPFPRAHTVQVLLNRLAKISGFQSHLACIPFLHQQLRVEKLVRRHPLRQHGHMEQPNERIRPTRPPRQRLQLLTRGIAHWQQRSGEELPPTLRNNSFRIQSNPLPPAVYFVYHLQFFT